MLKQIYHFKECRSAESLTFVQIFFHFLVANKPLWLTAKNSLFFKAKVANQNLYGKTSDSASTSNEVILTVKDKKNNSF